MIVLKNKPIEVDRKNNKRKFWTPVIEFCSLTMYKKFLEVKILFHRLSLKFLIFPVVRIKSINSNKPIITKK